LRAGQYTVQIQSSVSLVYQPHRFVLSHCSEGRKFIVEKSFGEAEVGSPEMLERLDSVPWAELEHACGSAEDVPGLLRKLLDPDPAVRSETIWTLYGNLFHQGTRYPATPYVIPFLIELCESSETPRRGDLLDYWKSLITGYFTVQERPIWGDGEKIYWGDEIQQVDCDDPYSEALHQIYRESLKGHDLLLDLLDELDPSVRAGSASVLACLSTVADKSAPGLVATLSKEPVGWVRAAIAFALGELGKAEALRRILADDASPEARCMAACELARISPDSSLVEPLLRFAAEPIEGYDGIPGAGGKSTGDAADAISHLPTDVKWQAAPIICERLKQTRSFDTMPLVRALVSTAFEPRNEPLTELHDAQRQILVCLVDCQELWSIANLSQVFRSHGLPHDRQKCAELAGVKFVDDKALAALSTGALFSKMGFHEKAREHIEEALRHDPLIFERNPSPDECWLYCAKAYAETDAERAVEAFDRAVAINPAAIHRVDPTWKLFRLLGDSRNGGE
jgi:tetratricopeptide (TPR) repeat protein